ncbi:MAG: class I SAM-dependent methyltransferase [Gemmatimonadota bacterium]
MTEPWQLQLYRRSIKKKETMRAVLRLLPPVDGKECLEIGCATGTSSWLLRQRGGTWTSADFDPEQVESAGELLGDEVHLLSEGALPFPDDRFDVVVAINFLEHLEDDVGFVREMRRVLKPGGHFLLTCPDGVSRRLGYRLKRLYGFTADTGGFGHVRDGYQRTELERLLRLAGLEMERLISYSRIFTELVENTLNLAYHRSAAERASAASGSGNDSGGAAQQPGAGGEAMASGSGGLAGTFHGETSPTSHGDFEAVGWKFRAYTAAYPVLRGLSLLDRMIPFRPGYMFCVRARKPALESR